MEHLAKLESLEGMEAQAVTVHLDVLEPKEELEMQVSQV